jgi:hypothetical protein
MRCPIVPASGYQCPKPPPTSQPDKETPLDTPAIDQGVSWWGEVWKSRGYISRPTQQCLGIRGVWGLPRTCPPSPRRIRPQSVPMMPMQPRDSAGCFPPVFASIACIESKYARPQLRSCRVEPGPDTRGRSTVSTATPAPDASGAWGTCWHGGRRPEILGTLCVRGPSVHRLKAVDLDDASASSGRPSMAPSAKARSLPHQSWRTTHGDTADHDQPRSGAHTLGRRGGRAPRLRP